MMAVFLWMIDLYSNYEAKNIFLDNIKERFLLRVISA